MTQIEKIEREIDELEEKLIEKEHEIQDIVKDIRTKMNEHIDPLQSRLTDTEEEKKELTEKIRKKNKEIEKIDEENEFGKVPKIKECPFCREDVEMMTRESDYGEEYSYIICWDCDVQMQGENHYTTPKPIAYRNLVDRWNKRVKTI